MSRRSAKDRAGGEETEYFCQNLTLTVLYVALTVLYLTVTVLYLALSVLYEALTV